MTRSAVAFYILKLPLAFAVQHTFLSSTCPADPPAHYQPLPGVEIGDNNCYHDGVVKHCLPQGFCFEEAARETFAQQFTFPVDTTVVPFDFDPTYLSHPHVPEILARVVGEPHA
ncbi:hypothetical protein CYMTET_15274 [Cymbomonas tetramitiformis]|uniref:Uncharacterized protein n=1 Tax=Cymbomonas tetramitiformis TaxID=36881 RepID=A0AAE0L933_9CHLO|nr:hypothetical protein CYMTET_15274 [Cymbomonas tetramitiformis]